MPSAARSRYLLRLPFRSTGMSVFSVLVKSTEKTGIEAAAAAGGKENVGDVPLMGLVQPDLCGHYLEASGTVVSFPTPPHKQSRTNYRYEMFFSSHTDFFDSSSAVREQANAGRVCKHDMKGRRVGWQERNIGLMRNRADLRRTAEKVASLRRCHCPR